MKRSTKIFIVVALVMLAAGIILFVGGAISVGFNFKELAGTLAEQTYVIEESFDNIQMNGDVCGFRIARSEDGTCRVVIKQLDRLDYSSEVINGTLTVRETDNRKWYERIGIFTGVSEAVVYLPEDEYAGVTAESDVGYVTVEGGFTFDRVTLKSDTGKISVNGVKVGALDAEASTGAVVIEKVHASGGIATDVSTGRTVISSVECASLDIESDTGRVRLANVLVEGDMRVENDTGNVILEDCDAAAMRITTDTGDVRGTVLSDKIFYARSDTGKVRVPKATTGGLCEIETDTGDIEIEIKK